MRVQSGALAVVVPVVVTLACGNVLGIHDISAPSDGGGSTSDGVVGESSPGSDGSDGSSGGGHDAVSEVVADSLPVGEEVGPCASGACDVVDVAATSDSSCVALRDGAVWCQSRHKKGVAVGKSAGELIETWKPASVAPPAASGSIAARPKGRRRANRLVADVKRCPALVVSESATSSRTNQEENTDAEVYRDRRVANANGFPAGKGLGGYAQHIKR
jgi:hypothetical protein